MADVDSTNQEIERRMRVIVDEQSKVAVAKEARIIQFARERKAATVGSSERTGRQFIDLWEEGNTYIDPRKAEVNDFLVLAKRFVTWADANNIEADKITCRVQPAEKRLTCATRGRVFGKILHALDLCKLEVVEPAVDVSLHLYPAFNTTDITNWEGGGSTDYEMAWEGGRGSEVTHTISHHIAQSKGRGVGIYAKCSRNYVGSAGYMNRFLDSDALVSERHYPLDLGLVLDQVASYAVTRSIDTSRF